MIHTEWEEDSGRSKGGGSFDSQEPSWQLELAGSYINLAQTILILYIQP